MDPQASDLSLARAFRLAYGVGLAICLAWPLLLQLMLGTAIQAGAAPPDGVVAQLGYTFTGLTFASAVFVTWRWGRIRRDFRALAPERRPGVVLRETILYAALFELSSLYGLIYYALGGPRAGQDLPGLHRPHHDHVLRFRPPFQCLAGSRPGGAP